MGNVIAPIKRAVGHGKIKCGGCKGTGAEHRWNNKAELEPTGNPCPTCDGTGVAPDRSPKR